MSLITDICGMHILLIGATAREIQPAADHMLSHAGRRTGPEISVLVTGVGLVPTTVALMQQLFVHRPDMVIQAGIAGSFRDKMLGEVVVVKEDALSDVGVFEEGVFRSVFDLGLAAENVFPYCNGYLVNPYSRLLSLPALKQVRGVSVHTITTDPGIIRRYRQTEGAVVESMEGAALHYVCLVEKIPFLQFRAISNRVGERDKSKWDIQAATVGLNQTLITFFNQLTVNHANRDWI